MRHPTKLQSFERLKQLGLPIKTIVDVGVLTCTGDLINAFPDRKHILIEPIVEWNADIAKNYQHFDYELINVAASDKDGEVTLELSTVVPGMPISHARIVDDEKPVAAKRVVQTSRIDSLLEARPHLSYPFLLKIDVDGAELMILSGAAGALKNCSVAIIEAQVTNFTARARPLEEAGFELFDIVDLAYYDGRLSQFDMVFVNSKLFDELGLAMYKNGFDIAKWYEYRPG